MIRIKYSVLSVLIALAVAHGLARAPLEIPNLSDTKLPPSELRAMIERYTSDRGSLSRSYSVEISTARQDRFKRFYSDCHSE